MVCSAIAGQIESVPCQGAETVTAELSNTQATLTGSRTGHRGGELGQDRLQVTLQREFHPTQYCEPEGQDSLWHYQCQVTTHVWSGGA